MKPIPTDLLVRFGEWAVWFRYPSRRQAEEELSYWRQRCSWPLKLSVRQSHDETDKK